MSSDTEEKAKQNARELMEKLQDLGEGKLPSNRELVSGIEELKAVPKKIEEEKGSQLSETGKGVLSDTTRVLESVERLVQEKNQGELFQETVLHAKKAGDFGGLTQLKSTLTGLVSQQDAQKAQQEAQQGIVSLITLVRLFFTSSEFRNVLFEFGDVCLDILSEQRIIRKFREEAEPKPARLEPAGIPRPISQMETTTSTTSAPPPMFQQHTTTEPSKEKHFEEYKQPQHLGEEKKTQQFGEQKPTQQFGEPKESLPHYEEYKHTQQFVEQKPKPEPHFEEYQQTQQFGEQKPTQQFGEQKEKPHEEYKPIQHFGEEQKPTATSEKYSATSKPIGETKQQQQFGEHKSTTTTTSHQELSQKDAEDRLLDKFLDLLPILKKKPEFRNSIRWLFMSLESLGGFLQEKQEVLHEKLSNLQRQEEPFQVYATHPAFSGSVQIGGTQGVGKLGGVEKTTGGGAGGETAAERELALSADNAKSLVERWINRPLDPLIELTDELAKKFERDQQTKELLQDIIGLVRKCIAEEGYLENNRNEVRNQFVEKRDTLRNVLKEKYEPTRKQLSDELNHVLESLRSDEAVQEFTDSFRHLMQTIFLDAQGNPILKPELIRDCQLIFPELLEKLRYVAIPKIEATTEDYSYCYEDIVVRTSELLPENFSINLLANISRDITKEDSKANLENIISVKLHDLRANITNIRFWYEKKTGFPKMSDSGLLDIRIYGRDGLSIELEVEPSAPPSFKKEIQPSAKISDKEPQTKIRSVKCKIHKLDLHFHETKHDTLYAIFSPFLEGFFKSRVESTIEESLKNMVSKIDDSIKSLPNPKEFIRAIPPPSPSTKEVES